MTDQEQIDALKAQVNCLRDALKILDRNSKAREALEATPEQCLAKVKAKAIEDVTSDNEIYMKAGSHFDKELVVQSVILRMYARYLREQSK